ncbi:MaoC family dehydratase [Aestuariimicrobium ganziense]|uniref:MaoC family dehydratase n=1 Tax=Aestuariimicrobium ganziense TaxID=2773677 RepID=UPI0019417B61|nr:MaoC/PaaZ C-terminal domain-containing protein [Aestuariimicrobium ganziense]
MPQVLHFDELPSVAGMLAKQVTRVRLPRLGSAPAPRTLPDRRAVVTSHRQDPDRLARYDRVCGYTVRDEVPASWLNVLTFPLQTALMAQPDFGFGLAGLVHVSNTMTLHRPVSVTEQLWLSAWADNLGPHRRGATFDMHGEVRVGSEVVWSGTSTYLVNGAQAPAGTTARPVVEPGDDWPTVRSQTWRLPADLGRQYAAVSGDVNPIHLHPATARLFGFKRPIVHGMWTHARAVAALAGALPAAHTVRVRFAKPVLLPTKVGFAVEQTADGHRFAVVGSDDRPRVVGVVEPAQKG